MTLAWPRAETSTHYISMGTDVDLAKATKVAIQEMVDFLVATWKMDKHQAYQLTSIAGDVAITQLVDGTMGVHVKMPKIHLQVNGRCTWCNKCKRCCTMALLCSCVGACSSKPADQPAVAAAKPKDAQHAGITTPHGDHSPHHGGMVMMNGDNHYEVVFDGAGKHRVWFSDAVREDLPASIASNVMMVVTPKEGAAGDVGADD